MMNDSGVVNDTLVPLYTTMDDEETHVSFDQTTKNLKQVNNQQPDEQTYLNDLDKCILNIELLTKNIKTLNTDIRTLKKEYIKIVKQLKKRKPKRKNNTLVDENNVTVSSDDQTGENGTPVVLKKKREPSGFVSPILISDELAEFLGVELGTMMPRTSVTKCINDYVKKHKLQDPKNGKNFDLTNETDPNAQKLKKILNIEVGNEVGYFNLQRYIKTHFISNNTVTSTSVNSKNDLKKKEEQRVFEDVLDPLSTPPPPTLSSKQSEKTTQQTPVFKKKSKRH